MREPHGSPGSTVETPVSPSLGLQSARDAASPEIIALVVGSRVRLDRRK